jgi:hypothetical protein
MVIRHAMEFSSAIGERYLWVNRLCIVQNDFQDGGTLSQVSKMDKIYGGAFLTIIAAAPEETYEKSLEIEGTAMHLAKSRDISSTWGSSVRNVPVSFDDQTNVREMSESPIVQVMSELYGRLSSSRWASRGWTYQEQILCKRAVIFLEKELFWDCQSCVWDGHDLQPGQDFAGIALRTDMGRRFSTRWWPDFSFYVDLICPYNDFTRRPQA